MLDKAIIFIKLLQEENYDDLEELLWKIKHHQDEKAKYYKNMNEEIMLISNSLDNEAVIFTIILTFCNSFMWTIQVL